MMVSIQMCLDIIETASILSGADLGSTEQLELKVKLAQYEKNLRQLIGPEEEFFSSISQELKTPLTSIKIATQLGKKLMEEGKLTEYKLIKLFDTLLEQLETCENLINTY